MKPLFCPNIWPRASTSRMKLIWLKVPKSAFRTTFLSRYQRGRGPYYWIEDSQGLHHQLEVSAKAESKRQNSTWLTRWTCPKQISTGIFWLIYNTLRKSERRQSWEKSNCRLKRRCGVITRRIWKRRIAESSRGPGKRRALVGTWGLTNAPLYIPSVTNNRRKFAQADLTTISLSQSHGLANDGMERARLSKEAAVKRVRLGNEAVAEPKSYHWSQDEHDNGDLPSKMDVEHLQGQQYQQGQNGQNIKDEGDLPPVLDHELNLWQNSWIVPDSSMRHLLSFITHPLSTSTINPWRLG